MGVVSTEGFDFLGSEGALSFEPWRIRRRRRRIKREGERRT